MVNRRRSETGQGEERSKREEREDRILDAAAGLITRWGYSKTTIDDIARQAGVAKGTIYLHWKSRDDLFWTLLMREDIRLSEDIQQRIASDPEGMTLHGLVKHTMLVTLKSPLAKGMLLMDKDMLGELVRRDTNSGSFPERMLSTRVFLEALRDAGGIRLDIDIQAQFYMIVAIMMGFLTADQWMPDGFSFSEEEIADMTAAAIQRSLEPRDGGQYEAEADRKQAVASVFTEYMDKTIEILKKEKQTEEVPS